MAEHFPVEEGEVFRLIMECLVYEEHALKELEIMGLDLSTMMIEGGVAEYSDDLVRGIVRLGQYVFTQLQNLKAYYHGYLPYCYHDDLAGDLVLHKYTHEDLQLN
jgi:hypothetical protein